MAKKDLEKLRAAQQALEATIAEAEAENAKEEAIKARLTSELTDAFEAVKQGKTSMLPMELGETLRSVFDVYMSLELPEGQFTKVAEEKTGIYKRNVQRHLQFARDLPKEVRDLIRGSAIDVVAELTRIVRHEGDKKALVEQLLNPSFEAPEPVVVEAVFEDDVVEEPSTGMQLFEGYPIDFTWPDGKGRVRDIDVAFRLELACPRNIREVAKGMPERLGKVEVRTRRVRTKGIDGIVQERPVDEGWYTEPQAIWVATQSRTEKADEVTTGLILGYVALREFLTKSGHITMEAIEALFDRKLGPVYEKINEVENARLLKAVPEDLTGWKHFWQTALIIGLGPTVGLMPGQGLTPGDEPETELKNKLSRHITTLLVDMRLHPRSKKMTEAEKAFSLKHHTRLREAKHDEAQSSGVIKKYRRVDPMIRESSIPMFWDAAVLHPKIGKRFGMEPRPGASVPAAPAPSPNATDNVIPIARPRSVRVPGDDKK